MLLKRDPADPRLFLSAAKDDRGVSEVVSDVNGELMNFWAVMKEPATFEAFARVLQNTPFSEDVFRAALAERTAAAAAGAFLAGPGGSAVPPDVARAVFFFVCARQSLAGRLKTFAPVSVARVRRGMNEQVSAWLGAIDGLPAVHLRLRQVLLRTGPALTLLDEFDDPSVFVYLDPPYPGDTRTSPDVYEFEMTDDDHRALLARLVPWSGKVLLSSYPNEMYDDVLLAAGWRRTLITIPNHASGKKVKEVKEEALYLNYDL